ncbi:hypothetical protein FDECE_3157 [Fusarium decemcellulare]|nr:hypothetical protein FDECE_3157 [Fusarium decemcellulare]
MAKSRLIAARSDMDETAPTQHECAELPAVDESSHWVLVMRNCATHPDAVTAVLKTVCWLLSHRPPTSVLTEDAIDTQSRDREMLHCLDTFRAAHGRDSRQRMLNGGHERISRHDLIDLGLLAHVEITRHAGDELTHLKNRKAVLDRKTCFSPFTLCFCFRRPYPSPVPVHAAPGRPNAIELTVVASLRPRRVCPRPSSLVTPGKSPPTPWLAGALGPLVSALRVLAPLLFAAAAADRDEKFSLTGWLALVSSPQAALLSTVGVPSTLAWRCLLGY